MDLIISHLKKSLMPIIERVLGHLDSLKPY